MGNPINTYITAGSLISSLGFSTEENLQHIRNYHSGIQLIEDKNIYTSPFMGGIIDRNQLQKKSMVLGLTAYSPLEQLFILTIQDTIRTSGIDPTNPDSILILSTTKGNINESLVDMGNRVAGYFRFSHSPIIISSACISGVSALIVASRLIREGKYKHAVVAGGDVLSRFIVSGFQSFKSVSPDRCRPYDKKRDGLSLGEACGAVLVTSSRQDVHDPLAILLEGGAISNDANHISGPSRTGDGLHLAISQAMKESGWQPEDISFVNTHGTATVYNDEMESKAIGLSGLAHTPLNSLKSYWGHTLGASGIIESIACMEQLRSEEVFGIYGFEESDVSCPLQISSKHRSVEMKRCIKTASGFGGCNAAIVLSLEKYAQSIAEPEKIHLRTLHSCLIESGKIIKNGTTVFEAKSADSFASFIRSAYKCLSVDDRKFYKMDNLCKLGYIAAEYLLADIDISSTYQPEEIGIVLANASASLDTDRKHQEIIDAEGDTAASPAVFVYTLPNVVMGEICIRHKIKGENTFFIMREYDEEALQSYVQSAMRRPPLRACIMGWCELLGENYQACFRLIEMCTFTSD